MILIEGICNSQPSVEEHQQMVQTSHHLQVLLVSRPRHVYIPGFVGWIIEELEEIHSAAQAAYSFCINQWEFGIHDCFLELKKGLWKFRVRERRVKLTYTLPSISILCKTPRDSP